jgi:hypothetical protein
MPERIHALWREPLLHFLLIGFALFLYYGMAHENAETPEKRIHIDRGQVQQLASNFERTWSRPPTAEELDAIVENHVREEVFYREAMAMGIDQNDPMVRRRMRMKLEFMLEDLSGQDASDEVLSKFLAKDPERYRNEALVAFHQVYLNPDLRPDFDTDASRLLSRLNGGSDPDSLGDRTLVPRTYHLTRQSEVARDFGEEFASQVVSLPPGDWRGPIFSPFGAHLVRLDSRTDARMPDLAEIRDDVLRDYLAEKRDEQKNLAYQKLREGYEVTVDPLNTPKTGMLSSAVAGERR